jgi:hypothetical protein
MTRPILEPLEGRRLLSAPTRLANGTTINNQDLARYQLQKANNVPISDRRFAYTTPEGTHVQITLYGLGTLAGTNVDANGALELVYDNTGPHSQIVALTHGGTGYADLRVLRDRDTTPLSFSGVGSNEIMAVKLRNFDLIDGGTINLAGGVANVFLHSIGHDTQIDMRALPDNPAAVNPSPTSPRQVLQFVTLPDGSIELTGVGGLTGEGTIGSVPISTSTAARSRTPLPAAINLVVDSINGLTPASGQPLGDAQILGYDPVANTVVRFNAVTGAPLGTIPVSVPADSVAGLGLGRNQGTQVALIGTDSTVQAYDVITGAFVGQFSTANLAADGFNQITGIAATDANVVLVDSTAGTAGISETINVTASIATGQAVTIGPPFVPSNDFLLTGGATGVAGSNQVFFTGAAHFNSFQPLQFQTGIMTTSLSNGRITPTARTQTSTANIGTSPGAPTQALGSIDQNLALVTSTSGGTNTVTLYSTASKTIAGTLILNYPNPITGLTESFHPELAGAAVINVGGSLHQIRAKKVNGLVLNDIGFLNRITIDNASNSTFVGLPVGHIQMHRRVNVNIYSSRRNNAGSRGAVIINPFQKPLGPLALPVR